MTNITEPEQLKFPATPRPLSRRGGPATSRLAAWQAYSKVPTHARVVLEDLYDNGDGTDFEGADRTGLGDNYRKRRSGWTLSDPPAVVATDITRFSPSRCKAIVWALNATGRAMVSDWRAKDATRRAALGGDDGEARE